MKRSIAIMAIALTAALDGFSQSSLQGFQSAFSNFAGDMAGSLAVNSTIGSNWSDAYVGGFPNFGLGVTIGAAFIKADSATSLFNAIAPGSLPSAFTSYGIPIPATVATFKIGLPFIPMDIGIKGGYIPSSIGSDLQGLTGVAVDYANIGVQLRYALVKQNLFLPNVSIGVAYDYQKGDLTKQLSGVPSQSFTVPASLGSYSVNVTSPTLALGWTSSVFDFTAQVSKQLLFLIPYAGAGFTVGKSTVTGGVNATTSTNYPTGLSGLSSDLAAAGLSTPSVLNKDGFSYSVDSSSPVFRIYGGLSFRIIVLDFDAQVMYVPAAAAFGASLTARVQI